MWLKTYIESFFFLIYLVLIFLKYSTLNIENGFGDTCCHRFEAFIFSVGECLAMLTGLMKLEVQHICSLSPQLVQ